MRKITIKKTPGSKPQLPKNEYAFIIGNGTTRKDKDIKQLMDYGLLYGCNWFFNKEFRPHILISSDEPLTKSIFKLHADYARRNWFYTWYPKPGTGAKKCTTPEKFAAGAMATHVAVDLYEAPKVFLIGMDFFGLGSKGAESNGELNNLYVNEKHYQKVEEGKKGIAPTYRNWQRRFQWMLKTYPNTHFYHVNPLDGKSPERLIAAPNWHQISWDNLIAHVTEDRDLIDIKNPTPEEQKLFIEENPDDTRACFERQISGQENVVMKDRIHPEDVLKIRLNAAKYFRQNPNADVQMQIEGHNVGIAPMIVQDNNGNVFVPNDEMIRQNWEIECRERHPQYQIPPKVMAPPSNNLTPPPPPPGMAGLAPPPPPPAGKPPEKMFEGLAPPPPPS
jgi:hypothetical protein